MAGPSQDRLGRMKDHNTVETDTPALRAMSCIVDLTAYFSLTPIGSLPSLAISGRQWCPSRMN